ncbi:MAG: hypothetical protein A3G49_02465 [Candidatus Sungbacteria bacterium RIFCSPLOWO2_12_FULL_41_11]|uniref:Plasmid stabilization protein n=1 Tax=Candidatus Sungbacteria bacterium RIFCSPLOWO2_12_FULL_41_11 TaxID=1802286 RepID=A0A1G2LNM3_9BACT|nr:MAG: hypothetical protein UV01_C0004G0082 [Parcubacteria group bacterium GW2011_GWA2_42_14]OGZ99000.1 MAG: hypothetical protein A3D41_05260 [Candidatus Sungbacteria bacterium RIFCSPHIGHO2_02_FULL_41_12b]OHA13205.1 MAG: hypothetical protein A3G49_02465 [Candidatus Sungbacteria bacterium RIFCSPLOWO2_12_FULL_41_11]
MAKYIVLTTSLFDREAGKLAKFHRNITDVLSSVIFVLENDPFNNSRHYDIRKLESVKHGEGQFRIRLGQWRIRYDVEDDKVILYSFRDRKEGY